MTYKHACVIDSQGNYKTYVLVLVKRENGNNIELVQNYTLQKGDTILEAEPPRLCPYQGAMGYIKPCWNGTTWIETATVEEIQKWEEAHPKVSISCSMPIGERVVSLETQVTDMQAAVTEAYEYAEEQNTNMQLALAEVYESLMNI